MQNKKKIKLLNDFFDSKVTTKENDSLTCDYICYEELTADGYEVFVFTNKVDGKGISVNEEVHYYNSNLAEEIIRVYEYHNKVIYVDEFLYDHLDIKEHLLGLFEEYVDEILDNNDSLSVKEINELKEEYGIEEETEIT
jgi:hypothetical protein|tara:strand:+ start:618 stop:1034 length:417 start_codon:yes stop_codon:yes gene_type:complete